MSLSVRQLPPAPTLTEALRKLRFASDGACNVRIEIAIQQPTPPLSWLAAQPSGQRLYWADRSGWRVAGWGFADVRSQLPSGQDGRYFGGMAFDGSDGSNFRIWRVDVAAESYLSGKPEPVSAPCLPQQRQ